MRKRRQAISRADKAKHGCLSTAHKQGKKSRTSDDNQGQPQSRVTRNVLSDVTDPRSSQETKSECKNQEGTWLDAKMCAGLDLIDQARIKGKNWSYNVVKLTSV